MYILGEPVLYRDLIGTSPACLPRFIRTIIWRPHLAEYVRNVNLRERKFPFKNKEYAKERAFRVALAELLSPANKARIRFLTNSPITPDNGGIFGSDKTQQKKLKALPKYAQRLHLPILTFAWLSVRPYRSKNKVRIRKSKLNIFVFRKD
jgi:hypothetical protein